jgi:hypothetical protein
MPVSHFEGFPAKDACRRSEYSPNLAAIDGNRDRGPDNVNRLAAAYVHRLPEMP